MIRQRRIQVTDELVGERLDVAIARLFPGTTRSLIRRSIASGGILLCGKRPAPSRRLQQGEEIWIRELYEAADRCVVPQDDPRLTVFYEDDTIVAFNKPAGMPVHPVRIGETGTAANVMVARYPETAGIGDPMFPGLVHRLDTDTSGILLAARTSAAYENLRAQFRSRTVAKEYLALVHGSPPDSSVLTHYLAHDPKRPGRMLVSANPHRGRRLRWMKAETSFTVQQRWSGYALLKITIYTGVTHQIRCQLAAAGWPVVGDALYGRSHDVALRQCLHAQALNFRHPATGDVTRLEAPVPTDIRELLLRLQR